MEAEATSLAPTQGELWVDVFGELSYASHAFLPNSEYQRTKAKSKTVTRNATIVIDPLDDVMEPELCKQPKNLREATYNRMIHHRVDPFSATTRFWQSGAPQFIVSMVSHYPKLMAVIGSGFNPTSCSTSGFPLRVVISPDAIRDMMCYLIFKAMEVFSNSIREEYQGSRRDVISFCNNVLNQNQLASLPKLPMSYSDLKHEDLKEILSILVWLCSHENDQKIMTAMMGFLFKCRKQKETFHFDFFVLIASEMVKQLSEFHEL